MKAEPAAAPTDTSSAAAPRWPRWVATLLTGAILVGLLAPQGIVGSAAADQATAAAVFQRFSTILVGIFIEAVPFLLFGVLLAALFANFVGMERLYRLLPKQRLG